MELLPAIDWPQAKIFGHKGGIACLRRKSENHNVR